MGANVVTGDSTEVILAPAARSPHGPDGQSGEAEHDGGGPGGTHYPMQSAPGPRPLADGL